MELCIKNRNILTKRCNSQGHIKTEKQNEDSGSFLKSIAKTQII